MRPPRRALVEVYVKTGVHSQNELITIVERLILAARI